MNIPIDIPQKSNVLIAGAGGGFDFLCALPVAEELRRRGHHIVFSNYSFSNLQNVTDCEQVGPWMVRVAAGSKNPGETYFPEGLFAEWYRKTEGQDIDVYCYKNIGVRPLRECFETIKKRCDIQVVILIDGGADGIFRGDEYELGTPSMDSISMIAANECGFRHALYCMTAFGSEGVGQEVSHAEVLERISDLIKADAFYGVASANRNDPAAAALIDASGYIFHRMPENQHSNVVCSLLSSLRGDFGYTAVNVRTSSNPVWISALTGFYWFFDLDRTARQKLFYDSVVDTNDVQSVTRAIERYRDIRPLRRPEIPI